MKNLILSISILMVLIISCKRNDNHIIPFVYVDLYINLANPSFNALNVPGNYVYITGGSRGIIVYRISDIEFKAFDRNCPYDYTESCAQVEFTNDNISLIDSCCSSIYNSLDGTPIKGPGIVPLKEYRTFFDGQTVHIYN